MQITVISSSTRVGRISHRIALALEREVARQGHQVVLIDLLELALPPFRERYHLIDKRPENWPPTMATLKAADGMIWVTPEYNGNPSPGLVNFVSVFAKEPFVGKPIGVATGSTGSRGGSRASAQVQQMILGVRAYPTPKTLQVSEMHRRLDPQGGLLDEDLGPELEGFVTAFLDFCARLSGSGGSA